MTPELNPVQRKVLTALRGATVLTRAPGVTTPDGHEHWFTLSQLVAEGRIRRDSMYAFAARALRRLKLVDGRTRHTVTYYQINQAGLLALAAWLGKITGLPTAGDEFEARDAAFGSWWENDADMGSDMHPLAEEIFAAGWRARAQRGKGETS